MGGDEPMTVEVAKEQDQTRNGGVFSTEIQKYRLSTGDAKPQGYGILFTDIVASVNGKSVSTYQNVGVPMVEGIGFYDCNHTFTGAGEAGEVREITCKFTPRGYVAMDRKVKLATS